MVLTPKLPTKPRVQANVKLFCYPIILRISLLQKADNFEEFYSEYPKKTYGT